MSVSAVLHISIHTNISFICLNISFQSLPAAGFAGTCCDIIAPGSFIERSPNRSHLTIVLEIILYHKHLPAGKISILILLTCLFGEFGCFTIVPAPLILKTTPVSLIILSFFIDFIVNNLKIQVDFQTFGGLIMYLAMMSSM